MITVVWFRQDLRVHDQPLLHRAAALGAPVVPLYVLPAHWTVPGPEGEDRLGAPKSAFLEECLADLSLSLEALGLALVTVVASPVTLLDDWHQREPLQVVTAEADAPEEAQAIASLRARGLTVHEVGSRTLLAATALPWQGTFPATFSRFRRQVERHSGPFVDRPEGKPPALGSALAPPVPAGTKGVAPVLAQRRAGWQRCDKDYFSLPGGEQSARQWLQRYLFDARHIAHYKQTRNQLIGEGYSSRLSAALAWGCLSVRQIWHAILEYEQHYGANSHSYWLRFELLWREFFHWSLREHGVQSFCFTGLSDRQAEPPCLDSLAQRRWLAWQSATTGLPFIDANLRELLATGYVSNRGRQVLASFLVQDLGLDWRLGARWFERHLVDHDVASNWGNWAYIAGYGHDARGGRRFSPTREWWRHDPDASYLYYWLPELAGLSRVACLECHFRSVDQYHELAYPAPVISLPDSDRVVS